MSMPVHNSENEPEMDTTLVARTVVTLALAHATTPVAPATSSERRATAPALLLSAGNICGGQSKPVASSTAASSTTNLHRNDCANPQQLRRVLRHQLNQGFAFGVRVARGVAAGVTYIGGANPGEIGQGDCGTIAMVGAVRVCTVGGEIGSGCAGAAGGCRAGVRPLPRVALGTGGNGLATGWLKLTHCPSWPFTQPLGGMINV